MKFKSLIIGLLIGSAALAVPMSSVNMSPFGRDFVNAINVQAARQKLGLSQLGSVLTECTGACVALAGVDTYIFSNSSGSTTLELPDATISGLVIHVKNVNTGVLTINPVLAQTIDGHSDFGLNYRYQAIQHVSRGGDWWVF